MASDPLRSTDSGIALIGASADDAGEVLRANHQLAELLETPLTMLVGAQICRYIHSGNRGAAHEAHLHLMSDPGTLYETKARLVTASRRVVPVHAFASAITTRTGTAIVLRVLPLND